MAQTSQLKQSPSTFPPEGAFLPIVILMQEERLRASESSFFTRKRLRRKDEERLLVGKRFLGFGRNDEGK